MKYSFIVLLLLTLTGCDAILEYFQSIKGEQEARPLYCVETAPVTAKRCFNNDKVAYENWQACVARGSDPVKCYTYTPPVPRLTEPPPFDCGEPPYFCFRYIVRELDAEGVDTWEDNTATNALALYEPGFCEYRDTSLTRALRFRSNRTDFEFDVPGTADCSTSLPDNLLIRIENVIVRPNYSGSLRNNPTPPLIRIDHEEYRPGVNNLFFWFGVTELKESLRGEQYGHAIGDFAFIANNTGSSTPAGTSNPNRYIIVFNGKFDLQGFDD